MKLNIKTYINNNSEVIIEDNSKYSLEPTNLIGEYQFEDTVSIDIITLHKIKENIFKGYSIKKSDSRINSIPINFDGWFSVEHIVLPSKEWFDRAVVVPEQPALQGYSSIYYSDGENIFKYIDGKSVIVPLDEIIEINPLKTTISKTTSEFVSICNLRKCYINLCTLIFNNNALSKCWSKNNSSSELIYKRDLVWMTINIIKYYTQLQLLYEVQRLIELISGCNGLCLSDNINVESDGCGCSK